MNVALVRLYRAVSASELADIARCGGFRPAVNTLTGKWFAETAEAATRWGRALYASIPFHVVQLDLPADVADLMFRLPWLDQIGPARYAEDTMLIQVNQQMQALAEVPLSITGVP
jgi:hypothetical protein